MPNLLNLMSKLDLWLGGLYKELLELQKESLSIKGSLPGELKSDVLIPLDNAIASISQLKIFLENQKAAIKLLKKAPPGMISSVIDFLHNVVVDPSSQSQKQTYYDKIKKLDDTLSPNQSEDEGSMLGASSESLPDRIYAQVLKSFKAWEDARIFNDSIDIQDLEQRVSSLFTKLISAGFAQSETDGRNILSSLVALFKENLKDPTQASSYIVQLLNSIDKSLQLSTKDPTSIKKNEKAFSSIKSWLASIIKTSSSKFASISDLQKRVDRISGEVKKYTTFMQNNTFITELESILRETKTTDPKEQLLLEKYSNYLSELFNPQIKSIAYYLTQAERSFSQVSNILKYKAKSK